MKLKANPWILLVGSAVLIIACPSSKPGSNGGDATSSSSKGGAAPSGCDACLASKCSMAKSACSQDNSCVGTDCSCCAAQMTGNCSGNGSEITDPSSKQAWETLAECGCKTDTCKALCCEQGAGGSGGSSSGSSGGVGRCTTKCDGDTPCGGAPVDKCVDGLCKTECSQSSCSSNLHECMTVQGHDYCGIPCDQESDCKSFSVACDGVADDGKTKFCATGCTTNADCASHDDGAVCTDGMCSCKSDADCAHNYLSNFCGK